MLRGGALSKRWFLWFLAASRRGIQPCEFVETGKELFPAMSSSSSKRKWEEVEASEAQMKNMSMAAWDWSRGDWRWRAFGRIMSDQRSGVWSVI